MITGLGSVSILTNDTKKFVERYRDKLGFEIVFQEGHSVFVRPGDLELLLHLCGKCKDWEQDTPGGRTVIWFSCGEVIWRKDYSTGKLLPASDPEKVEIAYSELKSKGVEFSTELTKTSWGKAAMFKDLENILMNGESYYRLDP